MSAALLRPRLPDGKPNLSPKGSLKVWDDETVSLLILRAPCAICAAIPLLKSIWLIRFFVVFRFKGRAEVRADGIGFCGGAPGSREGGNIRCRW